MSDFFKQLCAIQKLGQALRRVYPSWKILYIQESWQDKDWIREICHSSDEGTLVYAQTIIPQQTYRAHEAELSALGPRSIGDHFLFKRMDVTRSPFQCTTIHQADEIYPTLVQYLGPEKQFYKRESTFHIGENALSISEYFGQKSLTALGLIAS